MCERPATCTDHQGEVDHSLIVEATTLCLMCYEMRRIRTTLAAQAEQTEKAITFAAEVADQLNASNAEIARLRSLAADLVNPNRLPVACSYCSFEVPGPVEASVVQEHVLRDCQFHPLRDAERERDTLRAEVERLRTLAAALEQQLARASLHRQA